MGLTTTPAWLKRAGLRLRPKLNPRYLILVIPVLALAGPLGGCSASGSEVQSDVMLEVRTGGGLCADGPCATTLTVYTNGSWVFNGETDTSDGSISTEEADQFARLIDKEAPGLRDLPKTQSECPSATDGRDIAYTYQAKGAVISVSNCEVDLTTPNPLLLATVKLVGEIP